jgi:hypothetical protein
VKPKADDTITLSALRFYFDCVSKDRLDNAGLSRKSAEILALREKLITLSDVEFDVAIKTLSSMVPKTRFDESSSGERTSTNATTLYQSVSSNSQAQGGQSAQAVAAI